MQRLTRWLLLILVALLVFGTPSSFGGEGCFVCDSRQASNGDGAFVFCTYPEDGNWGFDVCRVECESAGGVGGCWCRTDGGMCLYIVVNG